MAHVGAAMLLRSSFRPALSAAARSGGHTIGAGSVGSIARTSIRGFADRRKAAGPLEDRSGGSGSSDGSSAARRASNADAAGRTQPQRHAEQATSKDDALAPSPQQPPSAPQGGATSAFDIDTSSLVAAVEEDEQSKKTQTGARSRGSRASREERSRKRSGRILTLAAVGFAAYMVQQLGREWDTVSEREKHGDDPASNSFFGRLSLRLQDMYSSAKAPVWEKLLPDPLPAPYQRPYTLILDVDDLLIHSEWSRQHAWRTAKRPGLDYFLGYLSQFYEIVLFSRQPMYIVAPVVEKLDPDMRVISYSLYRESCRLLDNGKVVKDLSHLNRDLSKVIAVDTDAEALCLQPENGIVLPPWKGERKDTDLVGLLSFLEAIGIYGIEDVRQTIKSFDGTHIPTEHLKRTEQARLREQEEWKAKQGKAKSSFLGGLRGATAKSDEVPKSWYEREQERFRQAYQEDQKFWQENGEAFRQQAKEEQEKKLKEMKLSVWGFMTGAAGDPSAAPQDGSNAGAKQPETSR